MTRSRDVAGRARRPMAAPALAALLAALVGLAACAKTGDVDRIEQENRVQDQRLRALEEGMSDTLRGQFEKLKADMEDLRRIVEGRTANINERLDQISTEQKRISEEADLNQNHVRRVERKLDDQTKGFVAYRTDAENELDKLRLRMKDIEGLLKSPIAGLPANTEPDKAFREAFFLLISGQLDLAIDKFGQFNKQYPKDPRHAEALFRQGQAYFLMRKYDYALVPLFEILDKHPQSKFVIEARWLLARSLEETGDLKLARDFYAQLINGKTIYSADASRRVAFMNKVLPLAGDTAKSSAKPEAPKPEPAKPDAAKPDAPKAEAPKTDGAKPEAAKPAPTGTSAAKPDKTDKPVKAEAGSKS